jgi:hypothetical protein
MSSLIEAALFSEDGLIVRGSDELVETVYKHSGFSVGFAHVTHRMRSSRKHIRLILDVHSTSRNGKIKLNSHL